MKILLKSFTFIFILLFAIACETDEDKFYDLGYIQAPGNVNAVFDITQDNTGLVTILPNAEGATKYMIDFGDGTSTELGTLEKAIHTYTEGVYPVKIAAHGITGLTSEITKQLNVTFKAPENLAVTISKDAANPKVVSVSATATFATIIDIYFGDVENEEPTHVLPGEAAMHTYSAIGDYQIKVIAKSAGAATTEYTETITIEAASDPINLPINFESFTINYAFSDFGGVVSSVTDNPDASGENTSAKVGQSVKTAGAETWGGTILTLENPIDFSVKKSFKVKVWSPKAGAVVKLKIENLSDGNINMEVDATTTVANAWEELSFDFSAVDLNNDYQKVVLFFDFGNVGDDAIYYFDDISLKFADAPSSSPVQDFEGEAPVFTAFGNAAIEVVANPGQSGLNTTAKTAMLTKAAGAETWAGAFFEVPVLDLDTYSNIKVKTWSPKSGIVVKLKLENADASIVHEVDITNTTANAWEELTYDFSGAPAADYVKIVMFFDFGNAGDGSAYYYDEIVLANEGSESQSMGFQDFEGEAPVFTDFGNAATEVVANPDMSGVNTTANVAKQTKPGGAETWAGSFFGVDALDLANYSKIKVKTWSPKSGIVIKLKLENADASIVHEVDFTNTSANAWEDLTYDFSGAPAAEYVKVVMFFDFGNAGDDSVYYYDEFELTN
jgi:hypothetical protein